MAHLFAVSRSLGVKFLGILAVSILLVTLSAPTPSGAFRQWQVSFAVGFQYRLEGTIVQLDNGSSTGLIIIPAASIDAAASNINYRWGSYRHIDRINGPTVNVATYGSTSQVGAGNLALSTCSGSGGFHCRVAFNPNYGWNYGTACVNGNPPNDFVAVATHEFGHWMGADHSSDRPTSGRNESPTMVTPYAGDCRQRSIEHDDVNSFLQAVPGTLSISSNRDFEETHSLNSTTNGDIGWKFLASTNGTGSATRYFDPSNALNSSYFIQFNSGSGNAASIYQDLYPRGPGVTVVSPYVYLRNNSIFNIQSYQLVVWNMSAGPTPYVKNCGLGPGVGYSLCNASFAINSDWLRVQIYLYGAGNVSVDNFGLDAND